MRERDLIWPRDKVTGDKVTKNTSKIVKRHELYNFTVAIAGLSLLIGP